MTVGIVRRGGPGRWRRWRPAGLGAAGTLFLGATTLGLARATVQAWPGLGRVAPDEALLAALLPPATLLAAWATAVLAAATLEVAPRARARARVTTRPVRLVSAALIALAGAGVPMAATAAPSPAASPAVSAPLEPQLAPADDHTSAGATPDEGHEGIPTPGWTPTRGASATVPASPGAVDLVSSGGSDGSASSEPVVVHRGDTLWEIAARHLGPGATDVDIAQEWPRWYAANRDLIGTDPDLIRPGQELVVPRLAEGER